MIDEPCSLRWCPHPARSRGLCDRHYHQWRAGRLQIEVRPPRDDPTPVWCECAEPDLVPIVMFGFATFVDAVECTRCRRPPRP